MVAIAEPQRLGSADLPDGRTLAWAEWGPERGRPVVLCPGAATSRRSGFAADALDSLGVRLISIDRPGLGACDTAPNRTLLSWADDVRQLAAARELGTPTAVETLERRIPSARRHLLPDAGGALLWTHGKEILDGLLARAA